MKHHTILSGFALSATLLAGCCATDHAQTQPPHQHSASSDAYAAVPGLPMTTVKTEQTQSPQSHQLAQFRPHQDRLQPVDPYIPRARPCLVGRHLRIHTDRCLPTNYWGITPSK